MAADIYTKSFTDAEKWLSACWLINVVDPKLIKNCIQFVTYDEPNMDDIKQAQDNQADDEPSFQYLNMYFVARAEKSFLFVVLLPRPKGAAPRNQQVMIFKMFRYFVLNIASKRSQDCNDLFGKSVSKRS